MGKIKLAILCLLLMAGGTAFFFFNAEPAPELRALRSAYLAHQEVLKRDPQNPALLYNEAWYLIQLAQEKDALKALNQALKKAPQNPKYLYTRAWLYQRLQQAQKAQEDLVAASRHAWVPDTLNEQLRLYALKGEAKQGLEHVQRELSKSLTPATELLFWQMKYQQQLGQTDAALKSLNTLSESQGTLPPDLQYRLDTQKAALLARSQDYSQAVATLKQALALKPTSETPAQIQALQHQYLEWQRYTDPQANLLALEDALKASPRDQALHLLRLDTLLEAKAMDTVRPLLIEARNAAPEDATLWCLQARYQWATQMPEAAAISLQEAQKRATTPGAKTCVAREHLRQLSNGPSPEAALRYWQQPDTPRASLYPALQHPDFKSLRKALPVTQ